MRWPRNESFSPGIKGFLRPESCDKRPLQPSTASARDTNVTIAGTASADWRMYNLQDSVVSFELTNDPTLIRLCVNQLLSMLHCLPLGDESERLRVGIALQEALLNACYHGNLEIAAEDYRSNRFGEIVAARMWAKPYLQRRISVRAAISRDRAEFVIGDEGSGFDVTRADLGDALPAPNESYGRRVRLMQSIMDEVSFNQSGNAVTMIRHAIKSDDDGTE